MGGRRETTSRLPDDQLAALAMAGESDAWSELARRHGRRVVVSLLARGLSLDRAEDLAQEVWLKLVQQQRAGRLAELRLPGLALAQADWLAKEAWRTAARRESIAPHVSLEALDRRRLDGGHPAVDPEMRAADRERLACVRAELERCPDRARQIFRAVYDPPGRSQMEVAEALGLSVQRVRQTLCEVRARLRRALERADGGDSSWNT